MTLKCSFYLLPYIPTPIKLPLVNRYSLEHDGHFLSLVADLLKRSDGFFESTVGEEHFGDPKRNLFLLVLELDVLLKIFETIFNEYITATIFFLQQDLLRLNF